MSGFREDFDEQARFYAERGPGRGQGRGRGRGPGRGPGKGRGRPPIAYPIETNFRKGYTSTLVLSSFEFQILQMADVEGLNQNEIAEKLQISQTSVWRYLKAARTKIAQTIAENSEIHVEIID